MTLENETPDIAYSVLASDACKKANLSATNLNHHPRALGQALTAAAALVRAVCDYHGWKFLHHPQTKGRLHDAYHECRAVLGQLGIDLNAADREEAKRVDERCRAQAAARAKAGEGPLTPTR